MDCTGKITQILQDIENKGILVTLSLAAVSVQELQTLKGLDKLSIAMKKYRKKRSLDANAYAWVLMSKLSTVLLTSKEEVYEAMLHHYGVLYEDEDGYITVTVKNTVDMSKIDGHWMRIKDNGTYTAYAMIKGSSEYDTAEMSNFIDGIVSECKELEIETLPPEELSRMLQEWKP